ncbi:hypothetical protein AGMMS50256_35760 [Betaproteobacteria bacterium]|nr:hypothetical protein AGMMS50256_35760 [Betaproteobacteria bacterium]
MQRVQASEIDITAIHHVDGSGLLLQQVEDMHVVQFPVGDVDEAGNAALEVVMAYSDSHFNLTGQVVWGPL